MEYITEEARNVYRERHTKITELIKLFVEKVQSSNNLPSSNQSNTLPTSKKYSFYSKKRPPLNLSKITPIPYTPYIQRDRTRAQLQLPLKKIEL